MSEAHRLAVVTEADKTRTSCDHVAVFMLKPEDVGYLAGFFDGEGTLDIAVQNKGTGIAVRVHISQSDPTPLLWIKQLFGGTLTHIKGKQYWMWCISNEESVKAFLGTVRPYLRVKRVEADTMAEYLMLRHTLSLDEKKLYSVRLRAARWKNRQQYGG